MRSTPRSDAKCRSFFLTAYIFSASIMDFSPREKRREGRKSGSAAVVAGVRGGKPQIINRRNPTPGLGRELSPIDADPRRAGGGGGGWVGRKFSINHFYRLIASSSEDHKLLPPSAPRRPSPDPRIIPERNCCSG